MGGGCGFIYYTIKREWINQFTTICRYCNTVVEEKESFIGEEEGYLVKIITNVSILPEIPEQISLCYRSLQNSIQADQSVSIFLCK